MELSETEFQQIVAFIKDNYGVNLAAKKAMVEGRLTSVMAKGGYSSYADYMQHVYMNPFGDEATTLVNSLTTNHTFFFREPIHFTFLKDKALPEFKKTLALKHDIGIWSAASSSGEEAFSIAMVIRDFFGEDAKLWDTTILATDVSKKALTQATAAVYDAEHVRDLPESWMKMYFHKTQDGRFAVNDDMKKQVLFRYFNLMEPFPFKRKFNIVFLRNVMIYFDEETKVGLLNKIYDVMEPGGYLFIGCTEIIDKSRTKFKYIQPSIYQK